MFSFKSSQMGLKHSFRSYLYVLIFLFSISAVYAQNVNTLLKKGKQAYEDGNYKNAAEYLEAVIQEQPDNTEAKLFASRSYLKTFENNSAKALKYLTSLLENEEATNDPAFFMLLADAYFKQKKFDNANSALDKVNAESNNIEDLTYLRTIINNASENYAAPRKGVVIKNLGEKINSAGLDYSAVMEEDHRKIFFTSRQAEQVTEKADDGYNYELIYMAQMNDDDEWQTPIMMDTEVSSKRHDATVQLIKNENKIIFYSAGDLFISQYDNGEWDEGRKIKEIATVGNETHCFVADKGNVIYFSSDYGTENEDLDLFYIRKNEEGKWTSPEPIVELNTPYDDDSPYIDEEGNFYFSSKGHNSMGGYDIFKTKFDKSNKTWRKPENLKHPINSVADDTYFNLKGKYAYLSSSRDGGFGSLDIYGVYMFDQVMLQGKVLDEAKQPISEAKITMKHEGHTFDTYTDINGRYKMYVPFDEHLDVEISKDDNNLMNSTLHVNLSLRNENKNQYDFQLGGSPSIANDKDGNNSMNYFAVNDLNNPLLRNSFDDAPIVNSVAVVKKPVVKKVEVVKKEEKPVVRFNSVNIYFDLNEVDITDTYHTELAEVANFLKSNPNIKLEIAGHSDAIGSVDYNYLLSARRAKKVSEYLVSTGVDKNQLIVVSYGQGMPEIKDDANNPKNRRVVIRQK